MYRYKPEDGSLLFKFDAEGSRIANGKVFDLSRYANHAAIINGLTLKPSPTGKPMFNFNGVNEYLRIGASLKLTPTNYTFAYWLDDIRTGSHGGGSIGTSGYESWKGTGVYWLASKAIAFWIGNSEQNEIKTIGQMKPGLHHHIITKEGANVLYMQDGVLESRNTLTTNLNPVYLSYLWYIGMTANSTYNLSGRADDIRLYNRALSLTEGRRLYNETRRYYGK